jgi:hypothetical protein
VRVSNLATSFVAQAFIDLVKDELAKRVADCVVNLLAIHRVAKPTDRHRPAERMDRSPEVQVDLIRIVASSIVDAGERSEGILDRDSLHSYRERPQDEGVGDPQGLLVVQKVS